MNKQKVVIIGSGLGGLLCGHILSREGYEVCILEKHYQIGGCLQTFKRNGCIFDTGVHYIGSLDKGQVLYRYFEYFGLMNKLKLKRLDEKGFDRVNFKGKEYSYAIGYDNFIENLTKEFPQEKEAIVDYTKRIKKICSEFPLYNLALMDKEKPLPDSLQQMESYDSFIKSITNDPMLQNVLGGTNFLYAGVKGVTPSYLHALINDSYIQSSYRLVDGGSQIADILAESIKENGGEILTKHEVKGFEFENKNIKSVSLKNGERIEADYFISSAHPVNTLEMIEPGKVRKAFRNRINSLENTVSVFTLYIILKENTYKYRNFNYYLHGGDDVWSAADYIDNKWPQHYMLFTPISSKTTEYADTAIVISYMKYKETKKWENTTVEHRGDDYIEFKNRKAEQLLDLIEKNHPGLRPCIKNYYTSTPLTYRDYTGTKEGSLYGISRDCNEPLKSYIPVKTKIPNLFFTGQNTIMHGILGVTIGAVQTCGEFVGIENLVNKIKKASE